MAYFPEQIMPANIKDESQDVRGNAYVITAADHNKIDEEIRAVEAYIGIKPPAYSIGFSGKGCGLLQFSSAAGTYPAPVAPTSVGSNNIDLLEDLSVALNSIRDDTVMVTSGVVAIKDPMVPSADGMIPWPASWAPFMTTLGQDIDDTTFDDEEAVGVLETLQLADVTGLDEIGWVSMINSVYTFPVNTFTTGDEYMAYGFSGSALPPEDGTVEQKNLLYRQLQMGSNVEIMNYWGVNAANNTLLKVGRKSQGTMSWVHKTGDLVFKGKFSINITPIMYMVSNGGLCSIDCYMTPNGRIAFRSRLWDSVNAVFVENSTRLYASYQAVLVRTPLLVPRAT
jgi:hypothetical protein